ncbi:MAG: ribosome recycling factor [Candidatus Poriferisodalaceae bacterium]
MSEFAQEICNDARDRMNKAVEHTQSDFSTVRTGRATSALVEKIRCEYYGAEVTIQQMASFSVPEARMLVISPFDKGAITAIEKGIQNSDLGINPSNDGEVLRLVFPPLTEDRRKDLVRVVKNMAEDGKIAARNLRRSARQDLEAMEKDKEISSDERERFEKDLDRATQTSTEEIDRALAAKEQELLEV